MSLDRRKCAAPSKDASGDSRAVKMNLDTGIRSNNTKDTGFDARLHRVLADAQVASLKPQDATSHVRIAKEIDLETVADSRASGKQNAVGARTLRETLPMRQLLNSKIGPGAVFTLTGLTILDSAPSVAAFGADKDNLHPAYIDASLLMLGDFEIVAADKEEEELASVRPAVMWKAMEKLNPVDDPDEDKLDVEDKTSLISEETSRRQYIVKPGDTVDSIAAET